MKGARLRVVRRWKKPAARPRTAVCPPPRPADLDNPYSPCYTRARSFAELTPRRKPKR